MPSNAVVQPVSPQQPKELKLPTWNRIQGVDRSSTAKTVSDLNPQLGDLLRGPSGTIHVVNKVEAPGNYITYRIPLDNKPVSGKVLAAFPCNEVSHITDSSPAARQELLDALQDQRAKELIPIILKKLSDTSEHGNLTLGYSKQRTLYLPLRPDLAEPQLSDVQPQPPQAYVSLQFSYSNLAYSRNNFSRTIAEDCHLLGSPLLSVSFDKALLLNQYEKAEVASIMRAAGVCNLVEAARNYRDR